MKRGWVTKPLGEVCTLQRGFDLPTAQRIAGPFSLVSSSGIIDTHIEGPVKGPGIVTGRSGSIGKIFFINEDFWPLNTTLYVRNFHGNDPKFIFYLLNKFDLKRFVGGAGVPTLNRNDVHGELVFIPEAISEQQRIVGILDEAFGAISNARASAQKNLQNARDLFESCLYNVFYDAEQTSSLVPLSDLATDITDGDHIPPPKSEVGVPFITIGNIQKRTRRIDFSDTFRVPREYFEGLKASKKPKSGDVLYTVTGSFGIPILIHEEFEFCFQRHIGLVRPKPELSSDWLYYFLMSPQVFKQANEGATGTAQKTVSLKVLRGFRVPFIPLARQMAAVAKLNVVAEETQRLESIYKKKLAALDELKQSLLHQAFSGQL